MNLWSIQKNSFNISDIEQHGSKYLLGNGFMGYRGTMEEYGAEQLVAINLAGFFDLADGSNWRESVNAPNPLYTVVSVGGVELNLSTLTPVSHNQMLDIKNGIHSRKTVFNVNGVNITIKAERFISMIKENIIALKYSVIADKDVTVTIKTGIDNFATLHNVNAARAIAGTDTSKYDLDYKAMYDKYIEFQIRQEISNPNFRISYFYYDIEYINLYSSYFKKH